MVIQQYGLTFKRIDEGDIEQLRQWRNADHVRLNMPNQRLISNVQQKKWFKKVNSDQHLFFLLSNGVQSIGCLNIRDIDLERKSGIPGVYIGDRKYLGGIVPVMAVCSLLNFCFLALDLEELNSPVLTSNKAAIELYKQLGFKVYRKQEKPSVSDTVCYKRDFLIAKNKLEGIFSNLNDGQDSTMIVAINKSEPYYSLIASQEVENTGIKLL
jgi:RimJ/RimL family protein N-acetyltransferase